MKQTFSIAEIQELLKGRTKEEGGEILSSSPSGNWCGVWYDWFCDKSSLEVRARKFIPYIMRLRGEWTKTHYIWLKNNCPAVGGLHDDIRISPLSDDVSYNIGFAWGNGTTRDREVFDTRVADHGVTKVKNCIEAAKLVNKLMNKEEK